MSRTYKPFSGPFAPMLTEFLAQKRAVGYQYLAGYWVFRKFDTFSVNYDVVDYALTKEIVEAWGQKQPNESDVYWSSRILYLQQFAAFLVGQGYSGYITNAYKSSRSQFTYKQGCGYRLQFCFPVTDTNPCHFSSSLVP